ncbi:hypothetical protein RFL63_002726 [Klebsiella aerogenes]|nr:hypothetical protein [Klebsiella aerogenes]
MTDINRLIASLKRRSAHVKEFGDDITFVKLEDLDALVEAMEKAQQQIQTHERAELTWMNALELPDDATRNDILPAIHAEKYTLRAANKRIAELESRTVTVKLPQAVSAGGQGYQEQVERILTAAGIKWEAE